MLCILDWIQWARVQATNSEMVHLATLMASGFSGQLGRLVEQYYWRFRFEKDAITGAGARKGASRGGESKAQKMKKQQLRLQTLALGIRKRHPAWSKMAVAKEITKQTGDTRTAKHITRYISKPKS